MFLLLRSISHRLQIFEGIRMLIGASAYPDIFLSENIHFLRYEAIHTYTRVDFLSHTAQ